MAVVALPRAIGIRAAAIRACRACHAAAGRLVAEPSSAAQFDALLIRPALGRGGTKLCARDALAERGIAVIGQRRTVSFRAAPIRVRRAREAVAGRLVAEPFIAVQFDALLVHRTLSRGRRHIRARDALASFPIAVIRHAGAVGLGLAFLTRVHRTISAHEMMVHSVGQPVAEANAAQRP